MTGAAGPEHQASRFLARTATRVPVEHQALQVDEQTFGCFELLFQGIDVRLERFDLRGRDLSRSALLALRCVRGGEVGAEVEQGLLDRVTEIADVLVCGLGQSVAECGVQLVDRSVGLDPEVILGHPGATEKIRFTPITAPRVDLHEREYNGACGGC